MKVLFAVSNEEISESIIKKYQKEYKEILSYKNVYYFNAILKELQKDKTYDRIVISEDLEQFTNSSYEQMDKFIYEKLDSISDEASNNRGNGIPIILICSDRREKGDSILSKLFAIGIYNAIIGNDRSVDEVCRLINRPRLKKETKEYYKITEIEEDVKQDSKLGEVSEVEIQNILAHYKRLGKNEDKYVESFNNIAAQYTDEQLRIIGKFLPLNVRMVLEEKCPKYYQVMSFNNSVSNDLRTRNRKKDKEEPSGTSEILLKSSKAKDDLPKSIVIPSAVNKNAVKKLVRNKNSNSQEENTNMNENIEKNIKEEIPMEVEAPKRRGRPRKNPEPVEQEEPQIVETPKRRGRPRKVVEPVVEENNEQEEETILPGFNNDIEDEPNETILPGFEDEPKENNEEAGFLPGFDDEPEEEVERINQNVNIERDFFKNEPQEMQTTINDNFGQDIETLLTSDKKLVTFIGTSKNGTSFLINNIAELMSSMGINTAILDATRNKNSYYIYTRNDEGLRNIATNSIKRLRQGIPEGIKANRNLTVYTSLPSEYEEIYDVKPIIETLVREHSLILIDCDFDTPMEYFKCCQEMYLVQSMDILTIQPLTAFLRELKGKNILDERKIRIILNKFIKMYKLSDKTIIAGMSNYNDPAMSYMTDLFDRSMVKYITIPFDEEIYAKYLENLADCDIKLKGYSKRFIQQLKALANMIYPLVSGKSTYKPPTSGYNNGFSCNMNTTLNKMKNRY